MKPKLGKMINFHALSLIGIVQNRREKISPSCVFNHCPAIFNLEERREMGNSGWKAKTKKLSHIFVPIS